VRQLIVHPGDSSGGGAKRGSATGRGLVEPWKGLSGSPITASPGVSESSRPLRPFGSASELPALPGGGTDGRHRAS